MVDLKDTCSAAIVQAEPILFDKDACIAKALNLIYECADHGAELIVFPELFVPGYPYGMNFGFTVGSRTAAGRDDWKRYYDNSILRNGTEIRKLIGAAMEKKVFLSIGYSERDPEKGTLYNTNMLVSPTGYTLHHRKLKPTGSERMVWGDANKDFFPVMETPWGNMGSLICWENYMPLARMAMYDQGITLYIVPNTNDNPEWQDTIRHLAVESHCYVLNADMVINKKSYPTDLNEYPAIENLKDPICRGGSCIIDPYGHLVSDCIWDQEGTIYAELDMQKVPSSRMELDVCGHFARPDVLKFSYEK